MRTDAFSKVRGCHGSVVVGYASVKSDPHGYGQLFAWMLGIAIAVFAVFWFLVWVIKVGIVFGLRAYNREVEAARLAAARQAGVVNEANTIQPHDEAE